MWWFSIAYILWAAIGSYPVRPYPISGTSEHHEGQIISPAPANLSMTCKWE